MLRPCKWNAVTKVERKLMANHALKSIAIKNESVKIKLFISGGRKSKSQARLHFKMKK